MSRSLEFLLAVGKRCLKPGTGLPPGVAFCLSIAALCAAPVHAGEAETSETPTLESVGSADEHDACVESSTVLCLHEGRYAVTVEFTANDEAEPAPAKVARPRTDDSGLFYFFDPNNWEMLVKVLDGCAFNEHHWVYAATASDVGIKLVVRDTTLPEQDAEGRRTVNSREYSYPPLVRPPRGENESEEDYARNVLARGHPALTEVTAFPDACPAGG
jgi:hypothetical protein